MMSSRSYRYTEKLYQDHPEALGLRPVGNAALVNTNAFEQFSFLYHAEKPSDADKYVQVLGVIKNKRLFRWIRSEYVTGPESFAKYKVAVPAANESTTLGQMAAPQVLGPEVGVTQTFITIGAFETEGEAQACFSYVKTRFARAMLYVLKVTQHNPRSTWKYVPVQDFTASSDIDWSKPIPEIDQQLLTPGTASTPRKSPSSRPFLVKPMEWRRPHAWRAEGGMPRASRRRERPELPPARRT